MKKQTKIKSIITLIALLSMLLACSKVVLAAEWEEQPTLHMPSASPYSYLPAPIRMPPARPDRMDNPIPNIARAPALITDAQGNKTLLQNGQVRARAERDGKVTYYSQGQKRFQRDAMSSWNLIRTFEYNGNRTTVKNEFGEVLGYEEYGLAGKIVKTYDSRNLLTSRFEYDNSGYWLIDVVNNLWKRYELGKPVQERRGGKYGALVAYWIQDGDSFWRVEKTRDADGNIMDGNHTRFDRWADEYYETYANDGSLVASFQWNNHRMSYEVDQSGHYKKYNLYGICEEGFINPDSGIAHAEWIHEWTHDWEGTRHLKAHNVFTNEVIYYALDLNPEKIDKITRIITQQYIDGDLGRKADDPNKIGLTQEDLGKEILIQDFIYFYEVENLSVEQVRDFFNIKAGDNAQTIYNLIQELKSAGKASSGLGFIAQMAFTVEPTDTRTQYALRLTVFDANNTACATVWPNGDPTQPGDSIIEPIEPTPMPEPIFELKPVPLPHPVFLPIEPTPGDDAARVDPMPLSGPIFDLTSLLPVTELIIAPEAKPSDDVLEDADLKETIFSLDKI
jgi:hypothetical protein